VGLTSVVSWLTTPPDPWQSIDFKAVTQHHDNKLTMFTDEWKEKLDQNDTGGKWGLPCMNMSPDHSSSKPYRTFVQIQEFLASLVRVCWATGVL